MEHQRESQRKLLMYFGHAQFFTVIALTLFSMFGCAARQNVATFVRQDTDLGYVAKVAVLPFDNSSNDEFAAKRIRDITTTQILQMGLFDVVDAGVVDSTLRQMAITSTQIDSPLLKRLGQRLGVQSFIHGTVESTGSNQAGAFSYPELSLTMKLIDAESSMVLWQCSAHRNGYSVWDRLFGLDPQDSFQLSLLLTQEMLFTIPK